MFDDIGATLIFGGLLSFWGGVGLFRRRLTLSFGRGNPPVATFTITGDRALICGAIIVLCGIILLTLCLYLTITQDRTLIEQGVIGALDVSALVLALFTFSFGIFVEDLMAVQAHNKKKNDSQD